MRTKAAIIASCCALWIAGAACSLRAQETLSSSSTFQDSTNELSVGVGKTVLVDTRAPISRVAVGLGDVAVAQAVSPNEIMIDGKAPGETSLIIWDVRGGRQFFNVVVRPSATVAHDSLDAVRRELRTELPQQRVQVSMEGASIFLRGTVPDLTSAARAVKIAATAGKVVNLLKVAVPDSDPQILLKVRFASVDRSAEKQLGINLFSTGFGNVLGAASTGQFQPPSITLSNSGSGSTGASSTVTVPSDLNLFAFLPGLNVGGTLQDLETKGVIQLLAEPNVLASNGKEASFLAGGEYPYPVVQGTSAGGSTAVTIEFKQYGIRLNFIPTIMPQGVIRLQVAPEVSSLDTVNEVTISGFTVPGITTRKVNTEVMLKDGQSFVIGGLLDNSEIENFSRVPFLADIPVLGKFFQSIQKTKNNSELLVIVTPEIVAPIPAGQPLPNLKFPGQFLEANTNAPMHTPDGKTAENTLAPAPATIPVETLLDSMQPEKPLVVESESGVFGTGSTSGQGGGSTSPAPQQ